MFDAPNLSDSYCIVFCLLCPGVAATLEVVKDGFPGKGKLGYSFDVQACTTDPANMVQDPACGSKTRSKSYNFSCIQF